MKLVGKFKLLDAFLVIRGILLLIVLGTILTQASAQFKNQFYHINKTNGLSNGSINAIVRDTEGFLWIGTQYGLNRYDGKSIKIFTQEPDNPKSLTSNTVTCLYIDEEETLWVGTNSGGMLSFDKSEGSFSIHSLGKSGLYAPSNEYITSIIKGPSPSTIYVSTMGGVYLYSIIKKTVLEHYLPNGIHSQVRSIYFDKKQNILWAGYEDSGISSISISTGEIKNHWLNKGNNDEVFKNAITSFFHYNDRLYVGTRSSGIFAYLPESDEFTTNTRFNISDGVNCIFIAEEMIYFGTKFGLYTYNSTTKETHHVAYDLNNPNSISDNGIQTIFQDKQGILWLGCVLGGVNYSFKDKGFQSIGSPLKVSNDYGKTNNVTAVFVDSKDNIWLGYFMGYIERIDGRNGSSQFLNPLPNPNGRNAGTIFCFAEDASGTIYYGSWEGGLTEIDPVTLGMKSYTHSKSNKNTIPGDDVRDIVITNDNMLWLAMHGQGLVRFDPKTKTFTHFDQLRIKHDKFNIFVFTLATVGKSTILAGTPSGLLVFDYISNESSFHNLPSKEFPNNINAIRSMCVVDSLNVWLGSNSGLILANPFSGEVKEMYLEKDGLPSNAIMSIAQLSNMNKLWISTSNGLAELDLTNRSIRNYSSIDGLASDEFISNARYTKFPYIYFGGIGGCTFFKPDSISYNTYQPDIQFTNFKINLNPQSVSPKKNGKLRTHINQTNKIRLPFKKQILTFEFVSNNFIHPTLNQYSYQLVGFNKEWVNLEDRNEISFINLPPGKYYLNLKGSNNDNIWSKIRTLELKIDPPWYLTTWAFVGYLLLLVGILVGILSAIRLKDKLEHKMRIRELESRKQHEIDLERINLFSKVSHEFRTPLTLIKGPLNKLSSMLKEQENSEMNSLLRMISENSNRLLTIVNQLLDFQKNSPSEESIYETEHDISYFLKNLCHAYVFAFQEKKATLVQNYEFEHRWLLFDEDKLTKIVTNILTNSLKFIGENGVVQMNAHLNEHATQAGLLSTSLTIEITDTGGGIPEKHIGRVTDPFYQVNSHINNQFGSGLGLALVNDLIRMHKGSLQIENIYQLKKRIGLKTTISIPVKKADKSISKDDEKNIAPTILQETQRINEPKQVGFKNGTLLIIDDNTDILDYLSIELSDFYHILTTNKPEMGLELAFERMPDLIISDIMMPGIDGKHLGRILKSSVFTKHLPLIFITALTEKQQEIDSINTGADDYITKPLDIEILKAKISNLIENRKSMKNSFSNIFTQNLKNEKLEKINADILSKLAAIVETNLDKEDIGTEYLARELGTSKAQLYRKLGVASGMGVKELVTAIKINKAAELLLKTNLSVNEISTTTGFKYTHHFIRVFKKHFGETPNKYRSK